MISVDISTKFISSETKVYIARPGAHYRLFQHFVDNSFVGPELPDLKLPDYRRLNEVDDLLERVIRSVAIRRWYISGKDDNLLPGEVRDYAGLAPDHATSQFLRYVHGFFDEIKKGDLIVLPPRSFNAMAEIGEVQDEPNQLVTLRGPIYGDLPLTGRSVKWLASLPKSSLPSATLDRLQKPSVLFLLPRSAWPNILRRAYGSYSTPEEFSSRFEITSQAFQTSDDFFIQAFFNFVSSNTERIRTGRTDLLSFKDGAFSAEGVAPDLYTNVNSPGALSLKAKVITPIVIAAMFALAVTVGPDAFSAAESGSLIFGNSQGTVLDDCTAEVSAQVITQLKLLGYDQWAEACKFAKIASDNTGIATTVSVNN